MQLKRQKIYLISSTLCYIIFQIIISLNFFFDGFECYCVSLNFDELINAVFSIFDISFSNLINKIILIGVFILFIIMCVKIVTKLVKTLKSSIKLFSKANDNMKTDSLKMIKDNFISISLCYIVLLVITQLINKYSIQWFSILSIVLMMIGYIVLMADGLGEEEFLIKKFLFNLSNRALAIIIITLFGVVIIDNYLGNIFSSVSFLFVGVDSFKMFVSLLWKCLGRDFLFILITITFLLIIYQFINEQDNVKISKYIKTIIILVSISLCCEILINLLLHNVKQFFRIKTILSSIPYQTKTVTIPALLLIIGIKICEKFKEDSEADEKAQTAKKRISYSISAEE